MPAEKPVILILTTHTGGGHVNLAQSLKGMLEEHYDVVIINPQAAFIGRAYTWFSQYFVKFLTWQYTVTNTASISFCLQSILALCNGRQLRRILAEVQPQLIITTHAMIAYATARANEQQRKRVPLVFQLTDLGQLHMTWFTEKHADAYLAPSQEIFRQCLEQGIAKSRLSLTGRPIRRQFLEASPSERGATLTALGFDPEVFTIFLQGGAKGSAGIERTIEGLLSAKGPLQIILAVGNNRQLAERYSDVARVRPLPFTDVIAPYMAAADVIVGKAGASFISEAFMLEKPFLVTAFIPGQEAPNLDFIERHNLGWVCLDTVAQQELLTTIAHTPPLIANKIASIRAYKAWNMQANEHIYPLIQQLLS